MYAPNEQITLSEAAKIAPGRPSTNCLWRWCRRGVLARTGERVRLQHTRIGGKIFTTAQWIDEFGRRLAEADAAYFELRESDAAAPPPRTRPNTRRQRYEDHRRVSIEHANRELEDAGL
jgi:hypothetical protein